MVNNDGIVIPNLLIGVCRWLQVRERRERHVCFAVLIYINKKTRTPDVDYGHDYIKESSCRNTHLELTQRELGNSQYRIWNRQHARTSNILGKCDTEL